MGCRASDHALVYVPFEDAAATPGAEAAADKVFKLALSGGKPAAADVDLYKTVVLAHLGKEYAAHGWAMQLHLASIRSLNSRMFKKLGPDTGYDAAHDPAIAEKLAKFFDLLESRARCRKPSCTPSTEGLLRPATVMGCFQGAESRKDAVGSAWWFTDHKDGMEER
jgi:glucuronate isomerase